LRTQNYPCGKPFLGDLYQSDQFLYKSPISDIFLLSNTKATDKSRKSRLVDQKAWFVEKG
jgi:hypothetical protein